jgi:hypothetical protein
MAFFNNFWALQNVTTYSSHVIGSFDSNTTTGGGIFRWVGGVNNASIPNIAGIRIKPINSSTGYWERVFDGPLNVSWFGCQNTLGVPNTFAQLGVSQGTLDSRYGTGFATTSDNYDTTAIRYAMKVVSDSISNNINTVYSGAIKSVILEPKNYWLTRTVELPASPTGYSGQSALGFLSIDGNGAFIKKANNNQFDFFNRYFANQVDADAATKYQIEFKNFTADGYGGVYQGSGYSFLTLAASWNCMIENINLTFFDIGIRLEWCEGAQVSKVNTNDLHTCGIMAKEGGWSGSSPETGCDNLVINQFTGTSVGYGTGPATAHILVRNCNNTLIQNTIINGFNTTLTDGIVIDSLPTTSPLQNRACKIVNTMYSKRGSQVGWTSSLIKIGARDNVRYVIDTVYCNTASSFGFDQGLINAEQLTPSIPGQVPIIELNNIYFSSSYPTTPTLPLAINTLARFRNVGTIKWHFRTVDFGNDPAVDAAAIAAGNNIWATVAPATIPSIDDIIYESTLDPCCGIQQVLDTNKSIANGLLFIGTNAGESNIAASDVIALGTDAASSNTSVDVVALGNSAALLNQGSDVVAIGNTTLSANTGSDVIAIGQNAGQGQSGNYSILFGPGAGFNNSGLELFAAGVSAGNLNTGDKVTAIGNLAGAGNSGNSVVAIGPAAANINSANYVIALGNNAGSNNTLAVSTIISNDCLPTYLNYAAASAAINAGTGATTGTYLYHDQTTNSIGAVRIP